MKKALIITSSFPPGGTASGTIRMVKFCKYFPLYGISPIVMTKKISKDDFTNTELLIDLPRELNVLRSGYFDFGKISQFIKRILNFYKKGDKKSYTTATKSPIGVGKYFYVPDGDIGWLFNGVLSSLRAVKDFKPDILISTSPSPTAHLVTFFIKKFTHIPWIADFRDPWINNPFAEPPTKIHLKMNKWLEKKVVKTADKVTGVSKTLIGEMISRYPELPTSKFKLLPNGFDEDDFKQISGEKEEEYKNKFIITHLGAIYGARSAENFILAMYELIKTQPGTARNILVRLVGALNEKEINLIEKMNLKNVIQVIPTVAHKKGLDYLLRSDCLLLIPGRGKSTITSKIFEYMFAQKPILVLLNEDNLDLKDFFKEMNLNHCYIANNQINDIKKALEYLCINRENLKVDFSQYEAFKEKYSRKNLTRELVDLIDELAM